MSNIILIKEINEVIYGGMPLEIKRDAFCNVLCKHLNASSASILQYSGGVDQINLKGNHINYRGEIRHSNGLFPLKDPYKEIIKNIKLFQVIDLLSEDFVKSESLRLLTNLPQSILDEINALNIKYFDLDYAQVSNALIDIDNLLPYYRTLKDTVNKDNYDLLKNPSTSGKLFLEIINNPKVKVVPYSEIEQKKFTTLLRNSNITHPCIYDFYVAYPLINNNRVFGILRLLFNTRNYKNLINSYESITQETVNIIGQYLGSQYSLDKIRKLDIHQQILNNKLDYFTLSEEFRDLINCKGVIIRLNDGSNDNEDYEIYGYSPSVDPYVMKLDELPEGDIYKKRTNQELNKILDNSNNHEHISEIIGFKIKFDLQNSKVDEYSIEYYYRYKEEIVRATKNWKLIKKNAPPIFSNIYRYDMIKLLNLNHLNEVLVFPIYEQKNRLGYISFANTSFRHFNLNDINNLYPLIQRLSLEISHFRQKSKIEALDIFDIYTQEVSHDLIEPMQDIEKIALRLEEKIVKSEIKSIKRSLNQFARHGSNEAIKSNKIGSYLLNSVQNPNAQSVILCQQIKAIALVAQLEISKVETYAKLDILSAPEAPYDIFSTLDAYLKYYIDRLNSNVGLDEKRKVVRYHPENINNSYYEVTFSKKLLFDAIWQIIHNAKKYSFNEKFPKFAPSSVVPFEKRNKDQIIIEYQCYLESNSLKINISNYGNDPGGQFIFEKRTQGNDSKQISKGTGNGLFIAKAFINKLNGTLSYEHELHRTTFCIDLPLNVTSIFHAAN